jgi:hypothetical protein
MSFESFLALPAGATFAQKSKKPADCAQAVVDMLVSKEAQKAAVAPAVVKVYLSQYSLPDDKHRYTFCFAVVQLAEKVASQAVLCNRESFIFETVRLPAAVAVALSKGDDAS